MRTKIALVTGGTGAIGSAICIALCQQEFSVIATHLPCEHENALAIQQKLAGQGYAIDLLALDVSSFDACVRAINDLFKRLGGVDILVNCAGITSDKTLRKMTEDDWQNVMGVNLDGVFNVTRQVVENMVNVGQGRIVNIASVNGQKGQYGQTNYAATKAGIHGFTMSLAQELAGKGITVNTVSPGYIATPMTEAIPDSIRAQIINDIPLGRMGTPNDIANVISFLVADSSSYITGANIPVNGGLYMSF